ncbi:MarR family transcriptional regulator [Nocardia higoensis]|uniref:MarR family transcriptional regulator n=1 Tax=Nocardia higoensis TaxID=228599 RepID=A0ABS0D9F4_9NOCA|nr:MarR family transcriptional regulator [Nocardia higoensis]
MQLPAAGDKDACTCKLVSSHGFTRAVPVRLLEECRAEKVSAVTATADVELWNRLLRMHSQVENRLATTMQRRHGLGLSEYRALGLLDGAPRRELRMQELADGLGLNQSSVTRLVGRLNAAGYTVRDLCPDDKRGAYTVLTDAGRTRYREARATYTATLVDALADIAADDPRTAAILAAARESLQREHIRSSAAAPPP